MAALVLASSVIMNGACSKQTPGMGPIDLAKLLVSAPELSGSQEALVSARSIVNDGSYIENLMRFTEQQQKDAAVAASVPGNKVDEVGQALALEHEKKIKGVIKEEQEREAKELSARLFDTSANSVLKAFKNSLLDAGASSFPSLSSSPSSSLPSPSSPSSSASDAHTSSSDSHASSSSDSSSSPHHHSHHSHPSTAHTWSQDEMRFAAPRQSLMPYGQSAQATYPYAPPSQYYHPMQSAYNPYPSAYDRTTYPSTASTASSYQALSYPLTGYSAPDATSSTSSSSSSAHHTKHHHENEDDNKQHRFRERNEAESREQEEVDYEAEAYAAAQAQLQAQAQASTPYNDYRFSSARTGGSSYYKNAFTGHDVAYSAQARYGSPPEPPLPDLPPPPVAIPQ